MVKEIKIDDNILFEIVEKAISDAWTMKITIRGATETAIKKIYQEHERNINHTMDNNSTVNNNTIIT